MSTTPAAVKSLVEKLIRSVTGLTPEVCPLSSPSKVLTNSYRAGNQEDAENFSLCREFALRNFKGYKFARTNQFDVAAKLSGWVTGRAILL